MAALNNTLIPETQYNGSANDIHLSFQRGLTLFIDGNELTGTPSNGLLFHFQRLVGSNVTSNQLIYQVHISNSGEKKSRIGTGTGDAISWTEWI